MYEEMTYDAILASMLASVDGSYDRREGSVIFNALAPAAAKLAQLYLALGETADRGFADTATGSDLNKKAAERGIARKAATHALRKGLFYDLGGAPMNIDAGRRFSGGGLVYSLTEAVSAGTFKLTCETAGEAGNIYSGGLIPVDYITGLGKAELSDVLTAGENEETDAALRRRYLSNIASQPFGGNIADYKTKVNAIPGVGGVKVTPAWNGGGTVKLTVISSDFGMPSAELVALVKSIMDPEENTGKGRGLAPIGHVVTVAGATGASINVSAAFTLKSGYTWADVSGYIEAAVKAYFSELSETWEESAQLYVRLSRIESAVLSVAGIEDIQNTKINGAASNLALGTDKIPLLGTVTGA
ncbi:MAG: baseplate J/gp47 family protein [Bacillota bacterium]|nr:baseplate J/gp47 family protein [Bacillota bacterium]